jgi:peptidoglycan/xylan/chitin deacetylase (PgdA/CDA1 family)
MRVMIILISIISMVHAQNLVEQFPEDDYEYKPGQDIGFSQYLAPSLYGTKSVVLTYDDGPHPTRTPAILDLLKKYQVTATFFVLSEKINDKTMPIIERMINEGHIIASHDHDHDNNNRETRLIYKRELSESINKFEDIFDDLGIHRKEMYYRFPYGDYGRNNTYHHLNVMKEVSQEIYGDNCINFAFWDIDTADWVKNMLPTDISQTIESYLFGGIAYKHYPIRNSQGRVIKYVKKAYEVPGTGGGVILMHDIHQRTVEATKIFLEMFKQRNVKVVGLNEVEEFSYGNKECIRI